MTPARTTQNPVEQFEAAVDAAVQECIRLGYRPSRFIQMQSQFGTLEASRRVLNQEGVSDGFTRLALMNRLDLSLEAIALQHPQCFAPIDLDRYRARLAR